MYRFVTPALAHDFVRKLSDKSVDLLLFDPPYHGVVKDSWDNQWKSVVQYVDWLYMLLEAAKPKLRPHASVVFFGGIGHHGHRPLFESMGRIERSDLLHYRNMITWKKRRAYGKSHDYLFTREEIVWYSMSPERTEVTFNIPLLDEERGYWGWGTYKAKSKYKRVSNVWTDIPELQRPERNCQKPIQLLKRLVATHSNPGELVVDPFAGWGTTGIAAIELGRSFIGCEAIESDADEANERCVAAYKATLATAQKGAIHEGV